MGRFRHPLQLNGVCMISIMDEIRCSAADLPTLLRRFEQDYLPEALNRNLILRGHWVSPPVAVADQPNTLWCQWELPDAASYYAMRSGQTPKVAEFWAAVDALALARYRHVMVPASEPLPQPTEGLS